MKYVNAIFCGNGEEMDFKKEYEKWCTDEYFDDETKKELLAIRDDEEEIKDRFYRRLEFGTGGLRGVIGAGTNRMNIYTVRQKNRKSLTGIFQLLLIRILRTARLGRSHLNLQKKKMQTLFLRQTLMQTDLAFMLRMKRQANM